MILHCTSLIWSLSGQAKFQIAMELALWGLQWLPAQDGVIVKGKDIN